MRRLERVRARVREGERLCNHASNPELVLRAPGLSNHQLQRRARRSSPYLAQQADTDRNVRATVCAREIYPLPTAHCSLVRLAGLRPTLLSNWDDPCVEEFQITDEHNPATTANCAGTKINTDREDSRVGTALRAVRGLSRDRTRSQRSGTRFPYTGKKMRRLERVRVRVREGERLCHHASKPELVLRAPGLSNHQLQRRARRSSPYLAQHADTDRNVRATVCAREIYPLPTAHCSLVRLAGLRPTLLSMHSS
jgi:hypothetical protein